MTSKAIIRCSSRGSDCWRFCFFGFFCVLVQTLTHSRARLQYSDIPAIRVYIYIRLTPQLSTMKRCRSRGQHSDTYVTEQLSFSILHSPSRKYSNLQRHDGRSPLSEAVRPFGGRFPFEGLLVADSFCQIHGTKLFSSTVFFSTFINLHNF